MPRICRHADALAFLDRAGAWLLRSEHRNGLVLGVASQVRSGVHRYRQPIYWATVEEDSSAGAAIVGCVLRTPPHPVAVTELPEAAIEPLVASLRETYPALTGVAGPERTATGLATEWTARFGGTWSVDRRQRLHSLTAVTYPAMPAPGRLRLALSADVPVARAWMAGFIRDTRARHLSADAAERLIHEARLYFWVDGEPRSMVGAVRDTPSSTGVAAVYTPPPFRGRGYASVAVATLSQRLLDSGRRSCFLYSDNAHPTSTALYRRIGYEPIDEVVDIVIV